MTLIGSPIPLRSSTEYSVSTTPYSSWQRCSSSHFSQLDYRDFCLLTWITMKGGNWSTTQRLSAQCWTRWICMFLLFLHLCTHVHCCYRFTNSPLPLSIVLPTWNDACATHSLHMWLIPCNVKTQWNSTYDILNVAVEYHEVIDDVTVNKSIKLWQYKLYDESWDIIRDPLHVLKVISLVYHRHILIYIRKQHCSFHKML